MILTRFLSVILMTKAFTVFMFCRNYLHDVCVCHLILQHSFFFSSLLWWLILYESELSISSTFINPGFGCLTFPALVFCRRFRSRFTTPRSDTVSDNMFLSITICTITSSKNVNEETFPL